MHYPLQLIPTGLGFSLFQPVPEQIRPVYEARLAKDPATPFPYWAKIWESALALTDFLAAEPEWVAGKQVLEIGAGIGLPSFSIARRAASVIISDAAAEAVELMQRNITELGLTNTRALVLDWNEIPSSLRADTVLLSDINYVPGEFEALLRLIRRFVDEGAVVILATPQRITSGVFMEALRPFVIKSALLPAGGGNPPAATALLILQRTVNG